MMMFSNVMIIEGNSDSSLLKAKRICKEILGKQFEKKIEKDICSDIIFIEARNKLSIGISEIRQIHEKSLLKPIECNFKIYILKNSQNLTEQAQNALLKILEDPPSHVIFLLLCKNYRLLLPTIISRSNLIILNDSCSDVGSCQDENCDKILEYLINDKKLKLSLELSKYSDKNEIIHILNKTKSRILSNMLKGKINNKSIFLCNKINYYIELISNNINKSAIFYC